MVFLGECLWVFLVLLLSVLLLRLLIFVLISLPINKGIEQLDNIIYTFDITFNNISAFNLKKVLFDNLLFSEHIEKLINSSGLVLNHFDLLKTISQLGVNGFEDCQVPVDVG